MPWPGQRQSFVFSRERLSKLTLQAGGSWWRILWRIRQSAFLCKLSASCGKRRKSEILLTNKINPYNCDYQRKNLEPFFFRNKSQDIEWLVWVRKVSKFFISSEGIQGWPSPQAQGLLQRGRKFTNTRPHGLSSGETFDGGKRSHWNTVYGS